MNVLCWHVHGSWMTSFVRGPWTTVLPVVAGRGPDGRGRARTWDWPEGAVERTPEQLGGTDLDVVVLQRPGDAELCERWTGRRPGRDLPAVWLEHNAPQGRIAELRHPAADRDDLVVVHVTHTNELFWDTGGTPTVVIEHGIVDPGPLATLELPRAAVVANEPGRRGRVVGTDLLAAFAGAAPVDLFGMGVAEVADRTPGVTGHEDLPQHRLHAELARRRVYVHPVRWTSLGLSLLEAMHLGLPVVALATTEVPDAVPGGVGLVSNRVDRLVGAVAELVADRERAAELGAAARAHALARFGLDRFLADWSHLFARVAGRGTRAAGAAGLVGVGGGAAGGRP